MVNIQVCFFDILYSLVSDFKEINRMTGDWIYAPNENKDRQSMSCNDGWLNEPLINKYDERNNLDKYKRNVVLYYYLTGGS